MASSHEPRDLTESYDDRVIEDAPPGERTLWRSYTLHMKRGRNKIVADVQVRCAPRELTETEKLLILERVAESLR